MTETTKQLFRSPNEFSLFIETSALNTKTTCLETMVDYCDTNSLEAEDIVKLVNPSLKAKLEEDFRTLNYFKPITKLEV